MTCYRLILPACPPKELTPNGRRRLHHMVEGKIVRDTRALFAPLVRSAWQGQPPMTGPLLGSVYVVLPKGRRTVDVDALPALVKPVLDELQGIAYVNDNQFTDLTYGLRRDTTGTYPDGCVVIDLEAANVNAAEVFHPGEYLYDELAQRFTYREFAARSGLTYMQVTKLCARDLDVTPEIAEKLGAVLGTSAQLWLNLQAAWDKAGGHTEPDPFNGEDIWA